MAAVALEVEGEVAIPVAAVAREVAIPVEAAGAVARVSLPAEVVERVRKLPDRRTPLRRDRQILVRIARL